MPLLTTILDYFRKQRKPIRVGCYFTASIDKQGVICLNSSTRKKEGKGGIYWDILHEFIHLDRKRVTGSYNGWGEKDGCNFSSHPVEREIEREVSDLISQNSLAYRILKKQLKFADFVITESGEDYFRHLEERETYSY